MKKFYLFLLLILIFQLPAIAQKSRLAPRKPAAAKPKTPPVNDKEELEKALAQTDLSQKIDALQKFSVAFPKSTELTRALELLVSARAQLADEKLRAGEITGGVELFKQAVAEAPTPMSDKLFSEVVLQFPTNLFYNNQQAAAVEIAKVIEEKVSGNAKQLLGLATFYIGTENGAEAERLAGKAIELDPQMPAAYQTLGLAKRLNFQLDDSASAYAKAAEIDPNSIVSKRSLAEMKRATGKPDEAVALYREILEKNPDDAAAQTGLALSLFDADKQPEAEAEMNKALEKNPGNLVLLVGAAYWYAAHKDAAKAGDFAQKAIAVEPRYTWAHIAMARSFLLQNRYTDAEKELLLARQYGSFPTLNYELAVVRLAAGFYQEAAQELKKSFTVSGDSIQANLGNRVSKSSQNFLELLAPERSASIFEPLPADSAEVSEKLQKLFAFNQKLEAENATDDEIAQAADEFIKGDDSSKTHRQLYAAETLLQAKKNLPKALELTQAAIGGVDAALQTPNAAGAIMADELYESRTLAISRGEVIVVPNLPNQTLSAILRGRIEETAGWTLFNENKPEEAIVRLKRAVSVLPEKSAWWRSSMWRLGVAFEASNKPALALDSYTKSYLSAPPNLIEYTTIERVYQQINGNLDGLEKKIGAKPADAFATVPSPAPVTPTPTPVLSPAQTPRALPESVPAVQATPELTPTPVPEVVSTPTPEITPSPAPETTPAPAASPTIQATPEISPSPTPSATPEVSPTPIIEATPSPTPESSPTPEITPESSPTPKANSTPSPTPTPDVKTAEKNSEVVAKNSSSAPFESIIIKVPPPAAAKTPKSDSETPQTAAQNSSDTKTPEENAPPDNSGATRPRVTNSENKSDSEDCLIEISQQKISLSANSGKIGVLVSLPENQDISKITVSSSSPADIEVAIDPDIGKRVNRAFYIIKSTSAKTGIYTVTFDSPCGKKEVQVRVR